MYWQTSRFLVDLRIPRVMGIVNVTPDSFSDGGQHASSAAAMAHCDRLLEQGADLLDIGGESTRPGAQVVPVDEELSRVMPVIRYAVTLGVPVSIDTYKPDVMQAALDAGADIVNDIWALRWKGDAAGRSGVDVVASHPRCGVCLMHMHRDPQTMQTAPMQGDVVPQVLSFLEHLTQYLRALGIEKTRICLDPGIGFGKTVEQNFSLLARQAQAVPAGYAVLAGWSRKSSLVAVAQPKQHSDEPKVAGPSISMPNAQRMVPSVTAAILAVQQGAHLVRVHDVASTVSALKVLAAMRAAMPVSPESLLD